MKLKAISLALALAISTPSMAMNPWKALVAALASLSLAQGALDQCGVDSCQYYEDYDAFGDYLDGLTNCEKEKLFPVMEARHTYIARTGDALANHGITEGITRLDAIQRMRDIERAYTLELKFLNSELVKTQEILFDDCTTKESKAILAKHAAVLADGIAMHHGNLQVVKAYLESINNA